MKTLSIAVLLIAALSNAYGAPLQARQQQRQQQKLQPPARLDVPARPNARRLLEEAVLGFYARQFQNVGEAEVFGKIQVFLQQFIQDRFAISQRRTRALNLLRQGLNRNASDDELKSLTHELDAADAEFQTNQEKFLASVDPLLNPRQQARVRILQNMADIRIRQMLDELQNPPAQRPNAAPAQSPD